MADLRVVRYQTYSGHSGWIRCRTARVIGEALLIEFDDDRCNWVPLHFIRGPIEVRLHGDELPESDLHYPGGDRRA